MMASLICVCDGDQGQCMYTFALTNIFLPLIPYAYESCFLFPVHYFYVTRNKILKLAIMDQWCYLAHDAGLAYTRLYYSELLIYYLETQYIYIYICLCVCCGVVCVCVYVCVRGSKLFGQYWKLTHSKLKWRNLRENVMMKRDVESANHVSID